MKLFATLFILVSIHFLPTHTEPVSLFSVPLSDDAVAALPSPNVLAGDPCIDTTFLYCQNQFNAFLGINTDITWQQSELLNRALNTIFLSGTAGALNICVARSKFYTCLGTTYTTCIDRYYLIGKNGNIQNAFNYVQIFNHLDFICLGGFEQSINNWECIVTTSNIPAVFDCFTAFNTTLNTNPNALCAAAATMNVCAQDIYARYCGDIVGWFICEDYRVGFAEYCRDLRCLVNGQA